MTGTSKVIVLDPDARSGRQLRLGFEREGVPTAALDANRPELVEAPDLVVVGGADGQGIELVKKARALLEIGGFDAPILFAGRHARPTEIEAAGADEVVLQPAFLRDVVTIGRILRGKPADKRAHIVGSLAETTGVFNLVRALSALGRSAVLTLIRGLRRGEVRFYHGEVTSAQVGLIHGQAALHQLLLWTDARFDFHHEDVVRRQQIPLSPEELFADAERFLAGVRDESGRLSPSMVLEQDVARIHSLGRKIPTEVHGVLRMFDGHRVLADILEDSPYRVFETLRVTQRAVEAGLLKPTETQRTRASWRAVLAIEEWLVGTETREAVVERTAALDPPRRDSSEVVGKKGKRSRKKKRANTPISLQQPKVDIDWGALVPRVVGAEVGPLAGVVPAAQASGEIPSRDAPRERLESLMDTSAREKIFPTDGAPKIIFDEAEELRLGAEQKRAALAIAEQAATDAKAAAAAAEAKAVAEEKTAREKLIADERAAAEKAAAKTVAEAKAAAEARADADAKAEAKATRARAEARAQAESDKAAAEAVAKAEALAREQAAAALAREQAAEAERIAAAAALAKADELAKAAEAKELEARAREAKELEAKELEAKELEARAREAKELEARAREAKELEAKELETRALEDKDRAGRARQDAIERQSAGDRARADAESWSTAFAKAESSLSESAHVAAVLAIGDSVTTTPFVRPEPVQLATPVVTVEESPVAKVTVHDAVEIQHRADVAHVTATPVTIVTERSNEPPSHSGGGAPDAIDDEPSDGVVRQMTTAETKPVRRAPPGDIPEDDRPKETGGEIGAKPLRDSPVVVEAGPSILVDDLPAAQAAVAAAIVEPAPPLRDAATPASDVAEAVHHDAVAFSDDEEAFFKQHETGAVPKRSLDEIDSSPYEPRAGFWDRLLKRKPPKK